MFQATRSRRQFLKTTALTGGLSMIHAAAPRVSIFVLADASDPIVGGAPV